MRTATFAAALAALLASAVLAQEAPKVVVPEGVYACANADTAAPSRKVVIENETNYAVYMNDGQELIPGLYAFRGGRLEWVSGPLKGRQPGRYEADPSRGPLAMRLAFVEEGASPYLCRLPPAAPVESK